VSAYDLARWAAGAFAGYDLAATHRIVTAVTGPGPLPDWVSARADPYTGEVALPRPVGVVSARVTPESLGEVVRMVLLTRNALLVEGADVADLARRAEAAGAPAGVLQPADDALPAGVVLDVPSGAPVVVIVDAGAVPIVVEPGAVVLTVGAGYRDLAHALRAARSILRESGGDRVRLHSTDPDGPLRVAAALPVRRVAAGDGEMPPPAPDGLITWTRISGGVPLARQPWTAPATAVPAYPYASNEAR
jgi:hypothetical protein